MIPDNLLLPMKVIKDIFKKFVNSYVSDINKTDANEKVKFTIAFSDNGVHMGSVNLLEFK